MSFNAFSDQKFANVIDTKYINEILYDLNEAFSYSAQEYFAHKNRNFTQRQISKIEDAYTFTWDMTNGQSGPQVNFDGLFHKYVAFHAKKGY